MAPRKSKAKATDAKIASDAAVGSKKQKAPRKARGAKKVKVDVNALPHGLGVKADLTIDNVSDAKAEGVSRPQAIIEGLSADKAVEGEDPDGQAIEAITTEVDKLPPKAKGKRTAQPKAKLGLSPYPDHERPTAEECYKLNEILSKTHGEVQAPEEIPVPSRTVAGCGEVKFVLEALVRTHLSAHTSMGNANRAIQGLLKRYPTIKTGPCAGSVDWNRVRVTNQEELEKAIKAGGMAPTKSKAIKKMLDMVYEENEVRRQELKDKASQASDAKEVEEEVVAKVEISEDPLAGDTRAAVMTRFANEVLLGSDNTLTLDYIHGMSPTDAFSKLMTYPGIGVKTAACVLLFCIQRPFFAVDTHVWRLCKWLSWVPEKADRNNTFWHCDVKVPDDLKYSLHQLMIAHGKSCGRCRASTSENSEAWAEGCPIEELVKRTGVRKGGEEEPKPKSKKRKAKEGDEDPEGKQRDGNVSGRQAKAMKKTKKGGAEASASKKRNIRKAKAGTLSEQGPSAAPAEVNDGVKKAAAKSGPKRTAAKKTRAKEEESLASEGDGAYEPKPKTSRVKANTSAKRTSTRLSTDKKAKNGDVEEKAVSEKEEHAEGVSAPPLQGA